MTIADDEILYCEKHPTREATLRCIRCNRPMCLDCALSTPTGYACRECLRKHEDRFYNASQLDYPITLGVCLAGNVVAVMLALTLGSWWIGFFIGGAAGGIFATLARRLTGRRVGRYSAQVAAVGAVIGGVLAPFLLMWLRIGVLIFDLNLLFQLYGITVVVCTLGFAAAVYTAYQRRI